MGSDDVEDPDRLAIQERAGLPGGLRPRTPAEFDSMYTSTPPWDIGRPQPAFAAIAQQWRGRLLDVGCGTGEHALLAASLGLDATGIDQAEAAIQRAEAKARERGLSARFLVHDALDLAGLGDPFDTVLDSGLFHVLSDDDRVRYVEGLVASTPPAARLYVLCYSDRQSGDWGPRRIREDELRAAFATAWRIDSIEEAVFETNLAPHRARAWLATIVRT